MDEIKLELLNRIKLILKKHTTQDIASVDIKKAIVYLDSGFDIEKCSNEIYEMVLEYLIVLNRYKNRESIFIQEDRDNKV